MALHPTKEGLNERVEALERASVPVECRPHPGHLASLLAAIEANDEKYIPRYKLIFHAVSVAVGLGLQAGIRIDTKEPDWPVAFIELPTGQVSWHIPPHSEPWDGHTTREKYRRCRAYIDEVCK